MCNSSLKNRVAAGIVTYNPEIERLQQNIEAVIRNNIQRIFIVDNGSKNIDSIEKLTGRYHEVNILKNENNKGIACALNQIFQMAEKTKKCEWVLTLDQDSVIEDFLMDIYSLYYQEKEDVVSVTSLRRERAYDLVQKHSEEETEYVNRCITSGNLVKITAWETVGGYDDELFIDMVDYDFCYKLREHGYKILRVNRVCILHELGKPNIIRFLGKNRAVLNHNAKRKYFYTRNYTYLLRKYKKNMHYDGESFYALMRFFIKTFIYEKEGRKDKLHNMIKGLIDGLRMEIDC